MQKPNFDEAERQARTLRMHQSKDLMINLDNIRVDNNIIIDTFQHYAIMTGKDVGDLTADGKADGALLKHEGTNIVLYDENTSLCHATWTVAHEIGHLCMHHTGDSRKNEIEAHWFAAEFLMPKPILEHFFRTAASYNGEITIDFIIGLFGVSYEAAQRRIKTVSQYNNYYQAYLYNDLLDKYDETIGAFDDYIQASSLLKRGIV